jgi:RNA recognition motif-containing protein
MAGTKLFVGCLPYSKTEADLKSLFEPFGGVQEISILRRPDGNSKGAAFVTYQTAEAAQSAMSYLQNYMFPGSPRGLNISLSGEGGGGGGGHQQQYMAPPTPSVRPGMKGGQMPMGGQQWGYQQPYMVQGQGYVQHRPQFAHQPMPPQTPFPSAAMKGGASGPPGSKVFVGQLPYSKSESDLFQLFNAIGPVAEVVLLKNKATNEKKGAGFVRFLNAQHAAQAVAALDGFTFAGSPRPISVSLAQSDGATGGVKRSYGSGPTHTGGAKIQSMGKQAEGSLDLGGAYIAPPEAQEGAKLFVGQLPFSRSEDEIKQVFSNYGQVAEVHLHRDLTTGQKKGGAFVRFYTIDDAYKALELDGYLFQGATRPITVSLPQEAGAKRQRVV